MASPQHRLIQTMQDAAKQQTGLEQEALFIQRIHPICITVITGPVLLTAVAPTTSRTSNMMAAPAPTPSPARTSACALPFQSQLRD